MRGPKKHRFYILFLMFFVLFLFIDPANAQSPVAEAKNIKEVMAKLMNAVKENKIELIIQQLDTDKFIFINYESGPLRYAKNFEKFEDPFDVKKKVIRANYSGSEKIKNALLSKEIKIFGFEDHRPDEMDPLFGLRFSSKTNANTQNGQFGFTKKSEKWKLSCFSPYETRFGGECH